MRCLLSVVGFGSSFAMFSPIEVPVPSHQWQGLSINVPTSSRSDQCLAGITVSNSSSVEGGNVIFSLMQPLPEDFADELCCELAGYTLLWTNVKYRPSEKYPDQFDYICTVYDGGEIVAGNDTTIAAKMPQPPPVEYHCEERTTIDDCIVPASPGAFSQCAWHGDACHKEPPIECGTGNETEKPFCLNIILADHALPGGPAGRQLGAFNWTDGTVSAEEPIVLQPTQVLELGGSNWWSVGSGYVKNSTGDLVPQPFQVCVRYNELLQDGTSDDDSWFVACATGPGLWDFSRGASSKMESDVYIGEGANNFWGTWVFWSNETVASALQV